MPATRRHLLHAIPALLPVACSLPAAGAPAFGLRGAPRAWQSARPFRTGCLSEPRTLNPFFAGDRVATSMTDRLFETVLGRWEDAPKPWLAELRNPANIQQIELDLNPGAAWQDGSPVTTDDVILAIDAAHVLGRFDDAWQLGDRQDVYLRIDLGEENAFFVPDVLRNLSVLPAKIWGDLAPGNWVEAPQGQGIDPDGLLGSGPYQFEQWERGNFLRLVKSQHYWGGTPGNEELLEWRFFQDPEALAAALCAGELDDVIITPANHALVMNCLDPDRFATQPYATPVSTNLWFNLNSNSTPFADLAVRRALLATIDRHGIADLLFGPYVDVVPGTQSPLSPVFDPDLPHSIPGFDVEWAQAQLAGLGLTLADLRFRLGVEPGVDRRIPELLVSNWSQLGISVEPEIAADWQPLFSRDFDVWLGRYWWPPSGNQARVFGSQGQFNFTGYSNPEYDQLTAQAKREADPAVRREILQMAELLLLEDLPGIFLWYEQELAIVGAQVRNFVPNAFDVFWSLPRVVVEE